MTYNVFSGSLNPTQSIKVSPSCHPAGSVRALEGTKVLPPSQVKSLAGLIVSTNL